MAFSSSVWDDIKSYYLRVIKSGTISRDSIGSLILAYNIDTNAVIADKDAIHFLFRSKNGDSTAFLFIDTDEDFNGGHPLVVKSGVSYDFSVTLEVAHGKSIRSKNYDLQVRPIFKHKGESAEIDLMLLYNNSMGGTFTLEGLEPINIEIRQSLIRKGFSGKNVTVNISKPGKALQKIDFKGTLPYYLGSQIVVPPYVVVVDSILPDGESLMIRYQRQADQPSSNYVAGQSFIDLELPLIADTSKKEYVVGNNRGSEFYLVDFWGSWCAPCLRDFDSLALLEKKFDKNYLLTIGIACEYTNNIQIPLSVLAKNQTDRRDFYVNINDAMNPLRNMRLIAYPTYILLDKHGKIIMREVGGGLHKVELFLSNVKDRQ